jgi:hypothetical protein
MANYPKEFFDIEAGKLLSPFFGEQSETSLGFQHGGLMGGDHLPLPLELASTLSENIAQPIDVLTVRKRDDDPVLDVGRQDGSSVGTTAAPSRVMQNCEGDPLSSGEEQHESIEDVLVEVAYAVHEFLAAFLTGSHLNCLLLGAGIRAYLV